MKWTKEHADILDSVIRYDHMTCEKREALISARAEIERLREALLSLVDCQNGPPLLDKRHKDAWEAAMIEARSILKEQP